MNQANLLDVDWSKLPAPEDDAAAAHLTGDGRITKVFYPVFPPDRNASDVPAWLKENPA